MSLGEKTCQRNTDDLGECHANAVCQEVNPVAAAPSSRAVGLQDLDESSH